MRALLAPRYGVPTLDTFLHRRAIMTALCRQLGNFRGTVLDIGCGEMPYKALLMAPPSRATRYIGLDLGGDRYGAFPDLIWDGSTIPLASSSVECALATEVLEHCPSPVQVVAEACRVLVPGGLLFFTVPFLWPLHEVPHDEYRYTPFSLRRILAEGGFDRVELAALGGWDAALAQILGLWVRRRLCSSWKHRLLRSVLSPLALPVIWLLAKVDRPPGEFCESSMITGLAGAAFKPGT